MKGNKIYGMMTVAVLLSAGLASCSQDDLADIQGEALPAGEYPLTLTATVSEMATRSGGKDAWTCDGTEYIGVRMGDAGTEAQYVITTGNAAEPASEAETLYWETAASTTITAWYPYEAATNADISDQSAGYEDIDFMTAVAEDQNYTSATTLTFEHQMAKVKYTLVSGSGVSATDLAAATVTLYGDATATFEAGVLAAADQTDGAITPCHDSGTLTGEALLVPQDMTGNRFIKVSVGGSNYYYTATSTTGNFQAGTCYNYNIIVDANGITVTVTSGTWNDGGTVNVSTDYTYTEDASGTRTYTVYNETGLLAWSDYVNEGHYSTNCTLDTYIDLSSSSSSWTAVGNADNPYTGTFDGNGNTIYRLTISASSDYQGLIGCLGSAGVVKNLTLEYASISASSNRYIGAVAGYNYGTVTNCYATGTVSGSGLTGGVVGYNCGSITACHSTGSVSSTTYTGGVVGMNYEGGTVTACYSTATVSGSSMTGGVSGCNYGTLTACFATGSVSGTGDYAGGVVGYNSTGGTMSVGTVSTCYWYNDASAGIGGPTESNDGATKVDGADVTWTSTALTAMNTALSNYSWQYEENSRYNDDDSTVAPLLLVSTDTE